MKCYLLSRSKHVFGIILIILTGVVEASGMVMWSHHLPHLKQDLPWFVAFEKLNDLLCLSFDY